jgi:prepilin-type N-terminal cleavage/methylation domain-containing protein
MRRRGFTLTELLIVITIMSIIMAFILNAALGGIRRAEEKATISLIAKLEAALTDRVDAIQNEHPEPTAVHKAMAKVYAGGGIDSLPRANVIAYYDHLRAELPDVFIVDASDPSYPLNFAGAQIAGATDGMVPSLPIGARLPLGADGATFPVTGMKGASFAVAGGIYSQLGYVPNGTDGNDNDGNGLIDDWAEGIAGLDPTQVAQIKSRLANHKHKTARAEMLYALLVEGMGPLGSSFSRDDFTQNEIKDTDNDGLMEFVDAWGEPLQFYRWPIGYHSDTQRGFPNTEQIGKCLAAPVAIGPYLYTLESREFNTLDPNQTLLTPAWWTKGFNSGANPFGVGGDGMSNASGCALTFQTFFHTLIDPIAAASGTSGLSSSNPNLSSYWDRSAAANATYGKIFGRRAYYTRFLVLSGGPDKMPGVAMLGVDYRDYSVPGGVDERTAYALPGGGFASTRDGTGAMVPVPTSTATIAPLIQVENQGGTVDPNRAGPYLGVTLSGGRNDTNTFLEQAGEDDITSQNIHALGGPLQ